jgi:phosphoglycerol transferase MdoB-like AlkP superfamily enzyme
MIHFKRAAYVSFGILVIMEILGLITKNSIVYKMNSKLDSEAAIVKRYGLIVNNIVDFYRFSSEKSVISSLQFGDSITIAKSDDPGNIIIIQMESIYSRVIETKYKGKPVAEFLDSISHCSIYFPYALTFHPNGTTDCEFTVINSVMPPESFPGIKLSTYDFNNTFLKVLTKANYDVNAFHNNNRSYFNRETAYPKMGFLHFYDMYEMDLKEEGWGASDGSFFDFMTNFIQSQKKPFCDYLITMSTHSPYENARRYYNNTVYDDIADKTTRNYYNSVAYLDGQLKVFVKNIQSKIPNTTIFIYGDHPSFVNDSNINITVINKDNCLLNFVPLIILTPEKLQKYDTTCCASLLDLAPTILSATSGGIIRTQGVNLLDVRHSLESDSLQLKTSKYSRKELYLFAKSIK